MARSIRSVSLPPVHPPPSFPAPTSPTSPTSPGAASIRSYGSAHRLAARASVDSGYASEYRPSHGSAYYDVPPAELAPLRTAHQHWRTAYEAQRTVSSVEEDIARCQAQLKEAEQRLAQLEKESRRPITSGGLGKLFGRKSDKQPAHVDLVNEVFTDSLPAARDTKARLEKELSGLKQGLQSLKAVAEKLDADYDALRKQLEQMFTSPLLVDVRSDPQIANFREQVKKVEEVYNNSAAETGVWTSAERAVQHAHRYYRDVLNTLDVILHRGGFERIMSDEHGTQLTYQEAVEYAKRAQACYDELVRLFASHPDALSQPPPELAELREVTLMQAATLYNLQYGGKSLNFGGVQKEKEVTEKKAYAVFERLTKLACWVQDYAKMSRTVTGDMRARRDADRAQLVAAWARCIPSGLS